jgi:hypothetical protein
MRILPRSLCLPPTLLLALAPVAAADILYVDANLVTGANDGSSWADAFQGTLGLKAAEALAQPGDQVFVAQGHYLPGIAGARGASFVMQDGVELYGSFLGTESTPAERPPFGTADSVLSGDQFGDDGLALFGDNSFHVVRAPGTTPSAVLDGFVIRDGVADVSGSNQDRGGGMLLAGGMSPTVRHCRFVANRSSFGGVAGYINNGSAPSFTDCSFEDGSGGAFGGAFDIATGGAVRFERCLFAGNTAARGGALEIFSTTGVVVDNCVFRGNVATGSSGGGALWLGSGGNTRVRNCTIVDNSATSQAAGGLRNQGTSATVVNCVFWDNSGPGGVQGADNQVSAGTDVTYSIVEGGYVGAGNLSADPALVDVAGGDVSPTLVSPGIDAGNNAEVEAGATLDFALQPRLTDAASVPDTGSGTAPLVDLGALEFQGSAWTDLGNGLAGLSGVPLLAGDGTLADGSAGSLTLSAAAPGAPCILFASLIGAAAPFKCGVLVPVPVNLQLALVTGGGGTIPLGWLSWPSGLSGLSLTFQYAVLDGAAICGVALSNAVRGDVP